MFPDIDRSPGTSNGDHDCGGRFASSSVVGSEPSELTSEGQSTGSVESGELSRDFH